MCANICGQVKSWRKKRCNVRSNCSLFFKWFQPLIFFPCPEMAGPNIPFAGQTVRTVAPSGRPKPLPDPYSIAERPLHEPKRLPGRVFIQGTAVHYPHDNIGWWELLVSRDTHHFICGPSLANFYDNSTIPRHCRFLPRAETFESELRSKNIRYGWLIVSN